MTMDPALLEFLVDGGLQVLRAVLVVVAAIIGLRLARSWTRSAMQRARVDTGTHILVQRGLIITFVGITILVVLGILGVNSVSLVTVAGAVGLAFSLAIQDILKNFFAGVYLLLERPFRVGDTIQVKEQLGVVENIGVRTTTLRTTDNVQVLVPNTVVFAEVVSNHTYQRPAVPTTTPTDDQVTTEPVTEQAGAAVVKRS
jgi:small-conductance mechanosensitive channel